MNETPIAQKVEQLFQQQMLDWPLMRDNYSALENAQVRELALGDSLIILQHNPERLRSSAARIDAASIASRPCFLCDENQPKEQKALLWDGGRYKIQVNPYPIFPRHFTIAANEHIPQGISNPARVDDLLKLAHELPDYVLFYNGAKCGASAPDHFHFQAGLRQMLPLCAEVINPLQWPDESILESDADGFIGFNQRLGRFMFLIKTAEPVLAGLYFARLQLAMMGALGINEEPMQNLLCWYEDGDYYLVVIPRLKHRPSCYGDGENQFVLSPASVDMGGLWTVPVKTDFDKLDATSIKAIYDELCLDNATAVSIIDCYLFDKE